MQAEPGQQVFPRVVSDNLLDNHRIAAELRLADKRERAPFAEPDDHRTAAPNTPRVPTVRSTLDQDFALWRECKPDRRRGALRTVLAHSSYINYTSL